MTSNLRKAVAWTMQASGDKSPLPLKNVYSICLGRHFIEPRSKWYTIQFHKLLHLTLEQRELDTGPHHINNT